MIYSDFLSFYMCSFSVQDVLQDTALHLAVTCVFRLLLIMTVSLISLVFDDLDTFEESWSGILIERLSFGICLVFFSGLDLTYRFWEEKPVKT